MVSQSNNDLFNINIPSKNTHSLKNVDDILVSSISSEFDAFVNDVSNSSTKMGLPQISLLASPPSTPETSLDNLVDPTPTLCTLSPTPFLIPTSSDVDTNDDRDHVWLVPESLLEPTQVFDGNVNPTAGSEDISMIYPTYDGNIHNEVNNYLLFDKEGEDRHNIGQCNLSIPTTSMVGNEKEWTKNRNKQSVVTPHTRKNHNGRKRRKKLSLTQCEARRKELENETEFLRDRVDHLKAQCEQLHSALLGDVDSLRQCQSMIDKHSLLDGNS